MKSYKENIHYYKDGDRVVFTALFHIQRGSCCGNSCRHCPYEPKHQKGRVVLAEKFSKFNNMNLSDLEKQLKEIEKIDTTSLTPEQLQELIDKLASITDMGEEMLSNDVQKIEQNNFEDLEDYSIDDYDKFPDSDDLEDYSIDDYDKFPESDFKGIDNYFLDVNEYNEENKNDDENNP